MGRRGPGALPQVEKREQYARLIAQGFSSLEACRIVGINPRTGKRWRHGRTITARDGRKLHYAPVVSRRKVARGACINILPLERLKSVRGVLDQQARRIQRSRATA